MIGPQREGGPFEIETYVRYKRKKDWWDPIGDPETVAVVYADSDQPSHCVRRFVYPEEFE